MLSAVDVFVDTGPLALSTGDDTLPVMEAKGLIRFGKRLDEALTKLEKTQSWLAEHSGFTRAHVSHLIKGDRNPTVATLQAFAPLLGYTVEDLARGTDAETRLKEIGNYVPQETYQEVFRRMLELEAQLRENTQKSEHLTELLGAERSRRKQAEEQISRAHLEIERLTIDLENSGHELQKRLKEVRRYEQALGRAIADVAVLNIKVKEIEKEVISTGRSAKLTQILSTVTLGTVITAAYYLGKEKEPIEEPTKQDDSSKKQRTKPGR